MRKVVAFALSMITLLTMLVLPVSAAEATDATVGEGVYGTDWVKYGDVDADEAIDAKDALAVLKYAVKKAEFTDVQEIVADVNKDIAIDAKDALDILKLAVGKITAFTAGVFYQITQNEEPPAPPVPVFDVAKIDKSNSSNGAYEQDPTADTSFKLDVSSLPKNTYYRIAAGVWGGVADVAESTDIQRLLFSLQGLINRDYGIDSDHTSLIYVTRGTDDTGWLTQMQFDGSILNKASADGTVAGLTEVRVSFWGDFIKVFGDVIKSAGIILWDGNVPATANVAATICGLDGYLPVLAQSDLHKTLVAMGVPVKQSLVGLFKNGQKGQKIQGTNVNSTGSAKNDAYLWALEKYFDRCSSHYLAYTLDGAPTLKGYDAYADHPTALLGDAGQNCLSNHDYLIARRCFFYDLAVSGGEAACDDPAQKNGQATPGVDNTTMRTIFDRRFKRANGAFGQLLGFPPWWLKYTSFNSQGGIANTTVEWLFVEYITCYNLAKEADAAHPCSMTNGSFYYKYIPKQKNYENNKKAENITYDPNTYYYTIYIGDYDSSAWLKQHMYNIWINKGGDRNLGKVKMMWSINPNLSERVPMVFDYLYENKSENDYFVGGDGGAGYIIPEALFTNKTLAYMGEKRPAANGNAGDIFAKYSKAFYDRFDMDVTGFIINGAQPTITKEMAQCISAYSPLLNFTNCYNNPVAKYNNTYFVYCQNGLDKSVPDSTSNLSNMYGYISRYMQGYKFGAYRTICWTPTEINKAVTAFETYAAGKGLTAKYCDPYTYLKMLKAANNAKAIS